VARAHSSGEPERATQIARDGLGLLLLLLLPAAGLAVGAAGPVVVGLYGADFAPAAATLRVLAPAGAAWTLVAVLAVLLAGAGRPWRAVMALGGVLVLTTVAVFLGGSANGADGTAVAVLAASLVAGGVLTLVAVPVLGPIIPVRSGIRAGLGALGAALLLRAWAPGGWWVFPYGALIYAVILGLCGGRDRLRRLRPAAEGVTGG
jgi:O-antigen/teichoic acid export membrane protein